MPKTFLTQDGSVGLYNEDLDDVYHSKFGAKKEAFEKFIQPVLNIKKPGILDICYGIGYNTKTALKYLKDIEFIDCIELDKELALNSYLYEFDKNINKIIENNLKTPDFIYFYFEDLRTAVKKLLNSNKKYNIIFHDGFTPHKQPEVWSEEIIFKISKLLDKNGIYCSYNHSKPVLNALVKSGLTVGKIIKENRIISTVASFNAKLIKNPLTDFEKETLNTKSAITYKDKTLSLTSKEILKNREEELKISILPALSSLKHKAL